MYPARLTGPRQKTPKTEPEEKKKKKKKEKKRFQKEEEERKKKKEKKQKGAKKALAGGKGAYPTLSCMFHAAAVTAKYSEMTKTVRTSP